MKGIRFEEFFLHIILISFYQQCWIELIGLFARLNVCSMELFLEKHEWIWYFISSVRFFIHFIRFGSIFSFVVFFFLLIFWFQIDLDYVIWPIHISILLYNYPVWVRTHTRIQQEIECFFLLIALSSLPKAFKFVYIHYVIRSLETHSFSFNGVQDTHTHTK